MTELVRSDVAPYLPPGRPVPRFVAAVMVVAVVLGLIAVVGPFRASVSVDVSYWRDEGDRVLAQATIANEGRLPLDVGSLDGRGLRQPAPLLAASEDPTPEVVVAGAPLGTIRLQPGETVAVTAVIVPDCSYYVGPTGPSLELRTEVLFGVGRTARADGTVIEAIADTVCGP